MFNENEMLIKKKESHQGDIRVKNDSADGIQKSE